MANKTTCESGTGKVRNFKSQAAADRANHSDKVLKIHKK
jgi:hypothetical protein